MKSIDEGMRDAIEAGYVTEGDPVVLVCVCDGCQGEHSLDLGDNLLDSGLIVLSTLDGAVKVDGYGECFLCGHTYVDPPRVLCRDSR